MRSPRGWRRFPLATVLLLAWLGGGLLAAAVATVLADPYYQVYGAANATVAVLSLLLLAAAGAGPRRRTTIHRAPARRGLDAVVAAPVPAQATARTDTGSSAHGPREPVGHGRR